MDIKSFGENSVIKSSWVLMVSRNLSICNLLKYLSVRIVCVFSNFPKESLTNSFILTYFLLNKSNQPS
jgi:hypothetical protein